MTPFFSLPLLMAALGISLTALPAMAQTANNNAPPVASDSRVKTFVFNENDVYGLLTYYGFQSNVEFGPKERIETVSIGDRAGWQVVPAGRRLFIRAVADKLHTNMTVVTNEHAYQFDLRATNPDELPQEELVYVIRFYYPDDPKNSRAAQPMVPSAPLMAAPATVPTAYPTGLAAPATVPLGGAPMVAAPAFENAPVQSAPLAPIAPPAYATPPVAVAPALPIPQPKPMPAAMQKSPLEAPPATPVVTRNRYGAGPFDTPLPRGTVLPTPQSQAAPAPIGGTNTNYTYSGEGRLLPYALFDDGRMTYFQFLTPANTPQLFRIEATGREVPVRLTRQGNYLVAPLVAERFVLRQGSQQALIYNEARTR